MIINVSKRYVDLIVMGNGHHASSKHHVRFDLYKIEIQGFHTYKINTEKIITHNIIKMCYILSCFDSPADECLHYGHMDVLRIEKHSPDLMIM